MDREQSREMRRLLDRWGHTLYYVKRKEEEIIALRSMIDGAYNTLRAAQITDEPKGGGLPSSGVERALEDVERRTEEYQDSLGIIERKINEALALKQSMDEIINEFDSTTQKILQMRYIDDHKWEYIALKLHYDRSRILAIEKEAIEILLIKIEIKQNNKTF